MTAPKHIPLVEVVAMALAVENHHQHGLESLPPEDSGLYAAENWREYTSQAKAAITACHAEEMREALKTVLAELWWCASQGGFDWKDTERRKVSSVGRVYDRAQALLAKLDGQS